MRFRRLGTSDLVVSEVGVGTWTLASDWWGVVDDPESLLHAALDCGINFIDVYQRTGLYQNPLPLVLGGVLFVVILSFLVSAVCGYMAGLIGSSNSPVSGVGILAVVICAAMMLAIAPGAQNGPALPAIALFITTIVFGVAVTSNDNLQDLKAGQIVGATPWRQQVMLCVGVVE